MASSQANGEKMHQEPTEAERILWNELRRKALCGLRFRRQHAVGQYIVDFFCTQRKLIIEVDGPVHRSMEEQDSFRQRYLENLGYTVLRFNNDEILFDLNKVKAAITEVIYAADEPPLAEIGEG